MRLNHLFPALAVAVLTTFPVAALAQLAPIPQAPVDSNNVESAPIYIHNDHFNGAVFILDSRIGIYNLSHTGQPVTTPVSMINRVRTHIGETSLIWLMFAGMKTDGNGQVNVTDDVTVLAPDRSVYDNT